MYNAYGVSVGFKYQYVPFYPPAGYETSTMRIVAVPQARAKWIASEFRLPLALVLSAAVLVLVIANPWTGQAAWESAAPRNVSRRTGEPTVSLCCHDPA